MPPLPNLLFHHQFLMRPCDYKVTLKIQSIYHLEIVKIKIYIGML